MYTVTNKLSKMSSKQSRTDNLRLKGARKQGKQATESWGYELRNCLNV
jgi:hypothetical protein